ncbi:hypothetical protein QBC34DRAFT_454555 [Podospora aff. communis PSN243]|uniref:Rhodopsin domain-containing protein n=1 Tax=Podospora aff. communis PSN243 TaxID=3040156 RepID=A0AAV9G058_9PEZI|nr:hypothetical protein QBC34DRAFT_454555 [Podospora aff. communis PSN243]
MANSADADAAPAGGYVAGESRSESLIAIVTCMMCLSTLVLLLRVFARARVQGIASTADEWTILISWLFSIAFTVNVCVQTKYGLGKHVADLPPTTNFSAALELFYYGEATYYITVSLTKMSILFLYLKLIPQRSYRVANWTMMAFVALTAATCVVAGIFQCSPIRRAWRPDVPGTCFNQVALYLSNAGLNILQDIIIYLLPVKTLWSVQLPRKQRIALVAVFVVGAFVCLTGILRLESLTMASVSKDPTWDNYGAAIWSSIESNVGIVCASLVHLKPLIARYAPSLLSIQRTTRLADDERSAGVLDKNMKGTSSVGRSTTSGTGRKSPFGILTEMELEENNSRGSDGGEPRHNMKGFDASDDEVPLSKPRNAAARQSLGIHKTTQFRVSYGDASPGGQF